MSDQEKTRYFEYMRPRYSNPSFASSNVGASLGMTYVPAYTTSRPNYRPPSEDVKQKMAVSTKFEENNMESKVQSNPEGRVRRSKSNLSSYGSSSLGNLHKFVNERDIYQKQEKKYNIITIQPKEYNETIKKYPKYRLENIDNNYYRKLKLQQEYTQAYNQSQVKRKSNHANPESSKPANNKQAQNSSNGQQVKTFRPKMLNNIDELEGVL